MIFQIELNRNIKKNRAIFKDDNGMSYIYQGTLKGCQNYIKIQERKLKNGKLIHAHKNIYT